jgi:hypothetical protein
MEMENIGRDSGVCFVMLLALLFLGVWEERVLLR